MLRQVVRGSSGGAFCIPTCNTTSGYALRIPQRRSQKSRRKRSCSDYAKSEPDLSVDKRGGTLRCNKKTWIKSARFGSNRFRAQNFNRKANEGGGHAAELKGLPRQQGVALRDGKVACTKPCGGRNDLRNGPSAAVCHYRGALCRKVVGSLAAWAMDRKWLCPTILIAF